MIHRLRLFRRRMTARFLGRFKEVRTLRGIEEKMRETISINDRSYRQQRAEWLEQSTALNNRFAALNNEHAVAQQKIKDLGKRNLFLVKENTRLDAENTAMRSRVDAAEQRARSTESELLESLKSVADTLALRQLGKRVFSKASVETPPSDPPAVRQSGKMFASDQAKRRTAANLRQFFEARSEELGKRAN